MAFNFQFSVVRGVAHLFLSSFPTVVRRPSVFPRSSQVGNKGTVHRQLGLKPLSPCSLIQLLGIRAMLTLLIVLFHVL